MTSRFRLILIAGPLALAGCGDDFNAGPIRYVPSERASTELAKKPALLQAITKALEEKFGPDPRTIIVPPNSGLPEGGLRLGNYEQRADGTIHPVVYKSAKTGQDVPMSGGYGLYRRYCLHCHGVQGGGDGPTADYLFPRPRDYRPGIFKFTSVAPSNPKPSRADLVKTITYGLHGTSMPAFEALMSAPEIEQVIDYVIFLSMRGEAEKDLVEEAKIADGDDPSSLSAETVDELVKAVFERWKTTESLVVSPKARRTPPTRESVLRGRNIFLGINTTGQKVACTDCHGVQAVGNGSSFIDRKIFDKIAYRVPHDAKSVEGYLETAIEERYREIGDEEEAARKVPGSHDDHPAPPRESFEAYKARMMTAWKPGSVDDWGNPLRPANLNLGVYKGGRRPIDLYWRIAKGINGAKMPSHANLLPDEQIWDVVNFVLALPYEPGLLKDAEALKRAASAPTATASVTPR